MFQAHIVDTLRSMLQWRIENYSYDEDGGFSCRMKCGYILRGQVGQDSIYRSIVEERRVENGVYCAKLITWLSECEREPTIYTQETIFDA